MWLVISSGIVFLEQEITCRVFTRIAHYDELLVGQRLSQGHLGGFG